MSLAGSSGLAPNLLVLSRACVILDVLSAFALVTDQISPWSLFKSKAMQYAQLRK